jgi:hypothetical protein
MSQRWEVVATRYDAEKLRIVGARNTPSLTDRASQAMPADPGRSSHETTGPRPNPTDPHPQLDDRSDPDRPTGTGS